MDYDLREVAVSRAIVENARRTILVCDRLKFERTAPIRICSAADIHAFVTDAPPPPAFVEVCARAGRGDRDRRRGGVSDGAGRPAGDRRRGQRLRDRPRRGRARAEGAAGRAGGSGAGDLVGLDQAVPRRPALSRVLRVPAGARVADRARDAAQGDAAHLLAAALRAAAPCGLEAGLDAAARAVHLRPSRRAEDPAADARRSTWRAIRPARRCGRPTGAGSNIPTAGSTTRGWWCCWRAMPRPGARRS